MKPYRSIVGLTLVLVLAAPLQASSNAFCGGAATPGDPSDLANVVGDQTIEYAMQQPANMMSCAKGYLLEKCGDHENAHKLFDKCIAAGYVGAMIWKALMLEDGADGHPDPAAAARLMERAAKSQDPAYAPLGKLHYATMLWQGRGVARDEAAARQWFESAAADGNPEAREFLRTGYHTGARDQSTLGAGTPPPSALVRELGGENASISTVDRKNAAISPTPLGSAHPVARRLENTPQPPAQAPLPPPEAAPAIAPPASSQRLSPVQPTESPSTGSAALGSLLALAAALAFGALHRRQERNA